MSALVIGFSGTRDGGTDRQLAWLYRTLEDERANIFAVHHGACVGIDASVHALALEAEIPIHVWPPTKRNYVAVECLSPHPLVTIHPAMPYLARDREIAMAAAHLVALPKQNEQPDRLYWGGTWYTVDFTQRLNRPVTICYPNGAVEQRLPGKPVRYDAHSGTGEF